MISSHISIINRAEQLSLYFYNGTFSNQLDSRHTALKPVAMAIETQIFSRIAGLLISPAAILELSFNLAALPLATIYCIGAQSISAIVILLMSNTIYSASETPRFQSFSVPCLG